MMTTLTRPLVRLVTIALAGALLAAWLAPDDADARRKRRRAVQPPLRILSITLTPESYTVGDGSLDFTVDVKLPSNLDGSTILEVSSLITSPSKRHLRFLWSRKPITLHFQALQDQDPPTPEQPGPESEGQGQKPGETASPDGASRAAQGPDQVSVTLRWDGTDQNSELVSEGEYDYVIRAKLLTLDGEKLRTHMVSWKKKGSVRVKPPLRPDPAPAEAPHPPQPESGDEPPQETETSAP